MEEVQYVEFLCQSTTNLHCSKYCPVFFIVVKHNKHDYSTCTCVQKHTNLFSQSFRQEVNASPNNVLVSVCITLISRCTYWVLHTRLTSFQVSPQPGSLTSAPTVPQIPRIKSCVGASFNRPSNFSKSISSLTSCQTLIRPAPQHVIALLISIPVMSFGRLHFHISKMSTSVSRGAGGVRVVYWWACVQIHHKVHFWGRFLWYSLRLFVHLCKFTHRNPRFYYTLL